MNNQVKAEKHVIGDELTYNGEVVLTYKAEYPQFYSKKNKMSLAVINGYYRRKAESFKEYCETSLYNTLVELYKTELEHGIPIRRFEALLTYEITYLESCIISLYFDRYEYTGGAHGITTRDSQTWNLQRNDMIKINRLINCPPDYKSYILGEIKNEIERDKEAYFEDYEELVAESFDSSSFYCTPRSVVVYFQQYDIAPYASGIREFCFLYDSCAINPVTMCSVK